jgi:hypothetical protein
VNNGLPTQSYPSAFADCDDALFVHFPSEGMFASTDHGQHWTVANNGMPEDQQVLGHASIGTTTLLATTNGVFTSSDQGQLWIPINEGLLNLHTSSIVAWNDTLYVGTFSNGIWKRGVAESTVAVPDQALSVENAPFFPNPASHRIHDTGDLDGKEFWITDMTGRRLLSGLWHSAEGVDVSGLSTGSYLIMIRSARSVRVAKLLIQR